MTVLSCIIHSPCVFIEKIISLGLHYTCTMYKKQWDLWCLNFCIFFCHPHSNIILEIFLSFTLKYFFGSFFFKINMLKLNVFHMKKILHTSSIKSEHQYYCRCCNALPTTTW